MSHNPAAVDRSLIAVQQLAPERLAEGAASEGQRAPRPVRTDASRFRLVSVNADGTDGEVHSLVGATIDIGRVSGNLVFDDPFLAGRHARIVETAEGRVLTALENRNGVYRRLRGPVRILDGDKILVGKQVLRFEVIPELERTSLPTIENGLAIFGTRSRPTWGRLLQLTPAGTPRDVYHLTGDEVVVGRDTTGVVISDDELISSRHSKLSRQSGQFVLEDLSSRNGTFLALREPTVLAPGDVIRMGNEVLRFEPSETG